MSNPDCIQVAVRIRPLVESEVRSGCQIIVEQMPPTEPQVVVAGSKKEVFTFNHVFAPEVSQDVVYTNAVQNLLDKLFEGYNVTILAYGQTGSGKTFSMGTCYDGSSHETMGVIPRAISDIFEKIKQMPEYKVEVDCSFMELYQESLYDLLSDKNREDTVLDIREDAKNRILIPGLTEIPVMNANDTVNCLIRGSSGRAVGATAMNATSSRSHAIFTINIKKVKKGDPKSATTAKFHLVDLAGSERPKKTQATGDRFKEGVKINQGLLALGNVISALGSSQGGSVYVGYRDSKLTRLLQDSLGGNSVTLMIACISPADYNCEETISTLRYADRARKIKNKPIVNQDPQSAEIRKLQQIIQDLRVELLQYKGNGVINENPINSMKRFSTDVAINYPQSAAMVNLEKNYKELQAKYHSLEITLQTTIHHNTINEMRAEIAIKTIEEINCINSNDETLISILKAYNEEMGIEKNDSQYESNPRDSLPLEDMKVKSESHTQKQINFNNELQQLNRELALKQELHKKIIENLSMPYPTHDDSSSSKSEEYESTIKSLEKQLVSLNDQLKSMKAIDKKSKLAEERRKKVQQLEGELQVMRKKSMQLEKTLKIKEKDTQRITNLSNEIQSMKANKVKLLKTMRSDSENFRQWKLNREKEICQLKAKDQKRLNEMSRMTTMYTKQQNVLKRKVEEAVSINKRLKESLEKQRRVQEKRNKGTTAHKNNSDQITSWIDHEIDVILSVVDASVAVKQLIEDRATLNTRLIELKQDVTVDPKEIEQSQQDLDFRNAQIMDLQQKILDTDIETKLKTICEGLPTMGEAKVALTRALTSISENRKEFALNNIKIEESKENCESLEETVSKLNEEIQFLNKKHIEDIHKVEQMYEEKLSFLLLRSKNVKVESEDDNEALVQTLERMDNLREQVEHYKALLIIAENEKEEILKTSRKIRHRRTTEERQLQELYDSEVDEEEEEEESSDEGSSRDPDFRGTPLYKRKRPNRSNSNQSSNSLNITETVSCGCSKNCDTQRCRCKKMGGKCSSACRCDVHVCMNRKRKIEDGDDDEEKVDKENSSLIVNGDVDDDDDQKMKPPHVPVYENDEFVLPTPKKSKGSDLDMEDILTPKYIYSMKKRKPLLRD